MIVRKNQAHMTNTEWQNFIDAINATHGTGIPKPSYRDFVKVHTRAMNPGDMGGMAWGVHTMGPSMPGRNFLAWHRLFLLKMEARLRLVHQDLSIPYWDAIANPTIPAPLKDPALLADWGVTRAWDPSQMPKASELTAVNKLTSFTSFQRLLEGTYHADVHNAVGGDMATSSSPSDPVFWLHHANIDRLWSKWQAKHPGANPPNKTEILKPKPIFTLKVSDVLNITKLGYKYHA